ncbi:hypothetical protein SeLEV6574_g04016 [Synchytrium endobioticum]|uniref:Uncharacterized protein n=1 Tax=Synchytrium endobioticum TaxID=286115 RepID=A0A507D1L8_9FUNG|nr:hypothetical protein SeLEV6574_g04016 [Synchytrium endobioticum]
MPVVPAGIGDGSTKDDRVMETDNRMLIHLDDGNLVGKSIADLFEIDLRRDEIRILSCEMSEVLGRAATTPAAIADEQSVTIYSILTLDNLDLIID